MLADGLSYVGFDESRQKCREGLLEQRFRAHYGVGSAALTRAIADLKRYQPNKQHDLRLLLMAASWLKLYDSEEVMAGRWQFGEKYCRETVREYVSRLQDLKPFKITFEGMSPTCTFAAVDTVHLQSQEFRCDPNSKWYSHKHNGPGVAFEVVCDPIEGKIVWINGPEPASISDMKFLRGGDLRKKKHWKKSSLYFNKPEHLMLIGDSAYLGQEDAVRTTKDAHQPASKKLFARLKSLQETCFKRMKDFKVLRESFRHGKGTNDKLQKIKLSFEACAVLLQYDFETGHNLFDV